MLLWFPETASALGCAYVFAGRVAEALPLLEEAEQRGAAMGTTGRSVAAGGLCERAYLLAGRMQDAVHSLSVPSTFSRTIRSGDTRRVALRLLGEIATVRTPWRSKPAAHHYRRPLALARNSTAPAHGPLPPRSGHAICQTGQRQQARAELSAAIEMYRAMDMTFWLPAGGGGAAQVQEQ